MSNDELDAECNRIMGLSEAELDAEIRAAGGDPADYARRGREAVEGAKLFVDVFRATGASLDVARHDWALGVFLTVGAQSFRLSHEPIDLGQANLLMMQFRRALLQLLRAAQSHGSGVGGKK